MQYLTVVIVIAVLLTIPHTIITALVFSGDIQPPVKEYTCKCYNPPVVLVNNTFCCLGGSTVCYNSFYLATKEYTSVDVFIVFSTIIICFVSFGLLMFGGIMLWKPQLLYPERNINTDDSNTCKTVIPLFIACILWFGLTLGTGITALLMNTANSSCT